MTFKERVTKVVKEPGLWLLLGLAGSGAALKLEWTVMSIFFLFCTVPFVFWYFFQSLKLYSVSSLILGFSGGLFLLLITLSYTAVKVNSPTQAVIWILIAVLVGLIGGFGSLIARTAEVGKKLWESVTWPGAIIYYLLLSGAVIILFGGFYSSIGASLGTYAKTNDTGCNFGNGLTSSVCFSASTYWSAGYGYPDGRILTILNFIQILLSVMIHVFILGRVITKVYEQERK